MATNDARVDTTFIGWLLIGFILLMFGVLGLQVGGLFGDITLENYKNMPIDGVVFAQICLIIAVVLFLLAIFAYRTGKKGSALVFLFFSAFLTFFYFDNHIEGFFDLIVSNSNWFPYVAFAIFFLIFAIYDVLATKAPKFVALVLLLIALMMFFMALASFYMQIGPGANYDLHKAMGIVSAVFAFLGFIIATYLGLAYADPKKIPVI